MTFENCLLIVQLEPHRNLVSQCLQGTGMVQINMEVKSHPGTRPRLNIVDILKPADDLEETTSKFFAFASLVFWSLQ